MLNLNVDGFAEIVAAYMYPFIAYPHIPHRNLTIFKVMSVIIIPSVSNEFKFCKNIYILNMIDTENIT